MLIHPLGRRQEDPEPCGQLFAMFGADGEAFFPVHAEHPLMILPGCSLASRAVHHGLAEN